MDYSSYDDLFTGKRTIYHSGSPRYGFGKFHIVIDKTKSNYTLLDSNFQIIDSIHTNPIAYFFTKKFKLSAFKRDTKSELRKYVKKCRLIKQKPDSQIVKMFKDMCFYIDLCPDANPNILELLRRNVTNLNKTYVNYQTASAEYLRELAKLTEGDPSLLPFDINFATSSHSIIGNHKYISNSFISPTDNYISDFVLLQNEQDYEREKLIQSHSYCEGEGKPKYKSERAKNLFQNQAFPYTYNASNYAKANSSHSKTSSKTYQKNAVRRRKRIYYAQDDFTL